MGLEPPAESRLLVPPQPSPGRLHLGVPLRKGWRGVQVLEEWCVPLQSRGSRGASTKWTSERGVLL